MSGTSRLVRPRTLTVPCSEWKVSRTCCIGLLAAGTGLVSLGAVSASAAFSSRHQALLFWMAAALYQVGQPL